MLPCPSHFHQMGEVFPSPFRRGVGKHGAMFSGEAAGFDFHRKGFSRFPITQEKVEAAVSHGHFSSGKEIVFPAWNFVIFHQPCSHIIGLCGIQVKDMAAFFTAHHPVGGPQSFPVGRQVEGDTGEEKFPHPPGIWHMA